MTKRQTKHSSFQSKAMQICKRVRAKIQNLSHLNRLWKWTFKSLEVEQTKKSLKIHTKHQQVSSPNKDKRQFIQNSSTLVSKAIHHVPVDARQLLLDIFSLEWFTMNTDETSGAGNYRKVIKHRFSDGASAVLNHLYCRLLSTRKGVRDWAAACGHVRARFQPTPSPARPARVLDEICCSRFFARASFNMLQSVYMSLVSPITRNNVEPNSVIDAFCQSYLGVVFSCC